jgi:hypothetical protein
MIKQKNIWLSNSLTRGYIYYNKNIKYLKREIFSYSIANTKLFLICFYLKKILLQALNEQRLKHKLKRSKVFIENTFSFKFYFTNELASKFFCIFKIINVKK